MENPSRPSHVFWIVGLDGKARKIRLPIQTPLLIGRGASNHVVLDDRRVSRQHVRVTPERDGTYLYDLSSANGTIVNGRAVTKHRLAHEDIVRVGRYTFRIEERRPPEDAAPVELETPTLIGTESISRALGLRDPGASGDRPLVDLTQLEDAYKKLGTLYEFMRAISTTIDRDELLSLIGAKLREVYPFARSVRIYLRNGTQRGPGAFELAYGSGSGRAPVDALPEDVAEAVLTTAKAVLRGQPLDSVRVPGGADLFAPMVDHGEVLGLVHLAADAGGPLLSLADLELLSGMAATSAVMLQNTRMHDEWLARDRLRYDLELAAKIQQSFLPREVVSVEGLELFAEYRAAYTIGGDFYDVFWVDEDRLAVFVGDISGKGIAAALLMARITSELRVTALAHVEPSIVLSVMNEAILASEQPELFFTVIYFTVNVKTGEVLLANAGHPLPYRCHGSGRLEPITEGASSAIGILESPGFEATSFTLAPDDSLVLYTDGVIEAADARGNLYGTERLERCLGAAARARPSEIAERIVRSIEEHAIEAVSDDLTLFVCHRTAGKAASLQPRRPSETTSAPETR